VLLDGHAFSFLHDGLHIRILEFGKLCFLDKPRLDATWSTQRRPGLAFGGVMESGLGGRPGRAVVGANKAKKKADSRLASPGGTRVLFARHRRAANLDKTIRGLLATTSLVGATTMSLSAAAKVRVCRNIH
jgi:hypothetical protein